MPSVLLYLAAAIALDAAHAARRTARANLDAARGWLAMRALAFAAGLTPRPVEEPAPPRCWRCGGEPHRFPTSRQPRRPVCAHCAWELLSKFMAQPDDELTAADLARGVSVHEPPPDPVHFWDHTTYPACGDEYAQPVNGSARASDVTCRACIDALQGEEPDDGREDPREVGYPDAAVVWHYGAWCPDASPYDGRTALPAAVTCPECRREMGIVYAEPEDEGGAL